MRPILVLGIGAEGPSGRVRSAVAEADFVAGGRRQLALIGPSAAETFAIADNLPALVDRLRSRKETERCVVLASGDPLCFGIGGSLLRHFPPGELAIEPAVSSLQLAFARAGIAWEGASIASVHGRPLEETLRPLLGRDLIGLFTRDGKGPGDVAAYFLDRGLGDYRAWVGEDLGSAEERVGEFALADLPGRRFSDLNFLILRRRSLDEGRLTGRAPEDHLFQGPDSGPILLTHADVRAVTLNRFRGLPDGPLWDVGAGLGGVSVDLARRFPAREVVAIERSSKQVAFLKENRLRFSAYNLRVVEGEAPAVLGDFSDPAGVFLGGSGGNLDAILDAIFGRILEDGVLVANFVGLENLARCLDRLKAENWTAEVTQVQIARGEPLAGLTTLVPIRPVWVVRSARPGSAGGSGRSGS